jgi:hypothetical protein
MAVSCIFINLAMYQDAISKILQHCSPSKEDLHSMISCSVRLKANDTERDVKHRE